MKLAHPDDAERIKDVLGTAPHLAMFPLSHLVNEGFAGNDARRITYWLKDEEPAEVLAVTNVGIVMPFLPGGSLIGAQRALSGLPVSGLIGPQLQVRSLLRLLNLEDAPTILDVDEPHFLLDIKRLDTPDGPGRLIAMKDAPKDVIVDWMEAYQLEALNTPPEIARQRAEAGYANGLEHNNRRVLVEDGTPLAMTAFNAELPDIVQIGGVYTPPSLRGKGHGRRVVALHLEAARAQGVRQATLSAATVAAARAYTAIGFRQIGHWSFVLFNGPQDHG